MTSISRYRNLLLFSGATIVLMLAFFWPEPKKPGELQKYYSIAPQQLRAIEYSGTMQLAEKKIVDAAYTINREDNPLKQKESLYRIEVRSLSTQDPTLAARVAELKNLKNFYGGALMRTIVQDWAAIDYYYILPHEPARDAEYGISGCTNKLSLTFKATKKEFCIGNATQGDTRRYILDREKDRLLIAPDFTVRRLSNNIFAQREQALHPYGDAGNIIDLRIEAPLINNYPLLYQKTNGALRLRMLVKDDEKGKMNVWHVDKILSIKPSHAAELANIFNALRVNATFASDATAREVPLAEVIKKGGFLPDITPALSGGIYLKRTDEQDFLLTGFAFYQPGVKAPNTIPFQLDRQNVRPLDSLVMSHFNAGYLTADVYPRLAGVLVKIETDLLEAQKKGAQEKIEREKKEAAQVQERPR